MSVATSVSAPEEVQPASSISNPPIVAWPDGLHYEDNVLTLSEEQDLLSFLGDPQQLASPHASERSWRAAASPAPYKWDPLSVDAQGKATPNARLVAEFGWEFLFGANPNATAPDQIVRPAPPFPAQILRAKIVAEEFVWRTMHRRVNFNQTIINRYVRDQCVRRHKDNHMFGDTIVCITIGSSGDILFDRVGYTDVTMHTERCSAYAMADAARRDWFHARPPRQANNQSSACYSVTFRTIKFEQDRTPYALDTEDQQ